MKTIYTCRYCKNQGTDEIFATLRYSDRSGCCVKCAEEVEEAYQKNPQYLTDKEIYDQKVDESKEG